MMLTQMDNGRMEHDCDDALDTVMCSQVWQLRDRRQQTEGVLQQRGTAPERLRLGQVLKRSVRVASTSPAVNKPQVGVTCSSLPRIEHRQQCNG